MSNLHTDEDRRLNQQNEGNNNRRTWGGTH